MRRLKLICLSIASAFILIPTAQAQVQTVRCTDAAGAVIGYAESAAYCPKSTAASTQSIAPASQPTAAQTAQARQLALSNQTQADALEAERLKTERAQAKANAAASQRQSAREKSCKKHALNIAEAQASVEEARMNALKKGATKVKKQSKPAPPSAKTTVTAQRADDEPSGAAYKKAQRKLALLEAKRDLDCK